MPPACVNGLQPVREAGSPGPIGGNGGNVRRLLPALSLRRRFCQHRLNGLYDLHVDLLPRCDDAKVPAERAAEAKVKQTPDAQDNLR
jgi:hypothetical protein